MEKIFKCKICDKIIKVEEHETGPVSFCECQNDLMAEFDENKWYEVKNEDKEEIVQEAEKLVRKILRWMKLDKESIESELNKTVLASETMFDIVDSYRDLFMKDDVRPMDFYYLAQDRLTGVYFYLSPIVSSLDSIIDRQSVRKYNLIKLDHEKTNQKFVSAPTEKESEYWVSEMKIYLSIFEGYLESCKMGIQTCRKRIKDVEAEKDIAR